MEVDVMTKEEQMAALIGAYMNMLRVQKAPDRDKEIGNQLRELRAKLEALGVVVDKLTID